ncbi:glycoside hydrolase family 3 N-terminal domain-containing protein [Neptunitalea lumnitzerae]|uniref:beta-N-acetylhexosaminidase n=1 Tax=Neptunitalea lumnitzerae TaxID=2965509 RepID=A0ABQ5MLD1_9FLAO|nr:glycoside hydrolase family 3 N-terminal domain-containing protein [Neptunitalea sp. Y10]GLB50215.1 beta-N-acetylglucosaminidase [Neptunitalea sp. Y10]
MQKTFFIISLLIVSFLNGQNTNPLLAPDAVAQQRWVDSVYTSLSVEERIGQLFVVDVFSSKGKAEENRIMKLVKENKIGGLIFSKGGPLRQAEINNNLQAASKVPLMVSMDAEWGLAMRLDSTYAFPWNMTLGALENNKLVEEVGYRVGLHAKRLGVHINFAPVSDINTNPKNPIIGNRSFGEDKYNVTDKAVAFMTGMQSAGVLANAKHFPGHGDTDQDSHKTLPTISFDEARIDSVELYPYRKLFSEGLASVMVAHLNVPALESRSNYPSSISEVIVTDLLQKKLGFKGLVFTDALSMKGASNFSEPGDIDLAAFLAGNDVLLISKDIPKACIKLKEAYDNNIITEERLAHSVKKILMAKYKVGLNDYHPVETNHLIEDLNTINDTLLYQKVMEEALTIVKNEKDLLPLRNLDKRKIAYVGLGDDSGETFVKSLQLYAPIDTISTERLDKMKEKLKPYNTVIIGLHRSNASPWKDYQFTEQELVWLYELSREKDVILDIFVKPYALLDLTSTTNMNAVVVSYQNSDIAQEKSAELIFGAIGAVGKLPVTANEDFPVNTCLTTNPLSRLKYGLPESVGMSSEKLKEIDVIANKVLKQQMAPGMQILVARKGTVIYNKSFGYHTFDKKIPVIDTDVFDVASLTKILASVPEIMKLVEEGTLSLDTKLVEMLPELKNTNKANITLKALLTHTARLQPWIPFYKSTLDKNNKPDTLYYRTKPEVGFSIQVSDSLYMRTDYKDSLYQQVFKSDLLPQKGYKYSDLGYFILKKYLEDHYKHSLDTLVQDHFYKSLGANHTVYNPLKEFPKVAIVPTEEDNYFRYTKVEGFVHDMGAAMLGGVGGHAGIFSNANDIAKIMQTYLQDGFYGGHRYFTPETIALFNTCYYCSKDIRRGAGFDKPEPDGHASNTCGCVPLSSFGHSGFTGTYTWADPENEIIYVFLSNRTYPTQNNTKLIKNDIRTDIQEIIYEAIQDPQ